MSKIARMEASISKKEDQELAKFVLGIVRRCGIQNDWKKLIEFSQKNEIIIPILQYLKKMNDFKEELKLETSFIQLLDKKMQEYHLFWQEIYEIHEILSGEGVDYAIIKTNRNYSFYDWNINVLIRQDDWLKTLKILSKYGWKKGRFLTHPLASIEPDKLLLERKNGFPIHLHRKISWNGIEYIPCELVLSTRMEIGEVFYSSILMDISICCAESIFENYTLSLGKAYFIMKNLNNSALNFVLQTSGEYGWLEGARLVIRTLKEIWNLIETGEKVEMPYKYRLKHLLKAWGHHAWKNKKYGLYEMSINLALWFLKL